MAVNEYVHLFKIDDGTRTVPTKPGESKIPTSKAPPTTSEGFGKKIAEGTIERALISPLNSATGGLASPAYALGKQVFKPERNMAAIGGGVATLAIAGVMFAISKMEQRISRMESKAEQLNNQDNTLIRAGSKGYVTNYKGNLSGVSSNTIGRG